MAVPLPNRSVKISIRHDQRVCAFGRTGSGKTTLVTRILQASPASWVILDSKHGINLPGVKVVTAFNRKLHRQIIRLPESAERYAPFFWDAQIRAIIKSGSERVIYNDELTLTNPSTRILMPGIGRAIRTGRGAGIAVWNGSQRPKDIPSAVFTEAEHFFIFQLNYAADRDKVVSFTGDKVAGLLARLRGHDFVYYNVLTDEAHYMEQ